MAAKDHYASITAAIKITATVIDAINKAIVEALEKTLVN